jgi:hypothetical protein
LLVWVLRSRAAFTLPERGGFLVDQFGDPERAGSRRGLPEVFRENSAGSMALSGIQ